MNLEPDVKSAWRLVVGVCRAIVWCAGTAILGAGALVTGVQFACRVRAILADELPCPRGHFVPTHSVYECGCGALHEGWVFGQCRVCGQSAGWTPCLICGLPVRSPLL